MTTARRTCATIAAGLAAALALTGCTTGATTDAARSPEAQAPVELTVFAAASLRDVLEDVGADFAAEQAEDGREVHLTWSFAGSADLVAQLEAGAPADVLVTADEATMQRAADQDLLAADPVVVATNTLTLVTPPGNPGGVMGLDPSLEGVDLVVCAPQVPCGRATRELADAAGATLTPVSEENSVSDVLGKVTSGQANAGVVYRTDARRAGDAVTTVEIAGAGDVVNRYPAAVTSTRADAGPVAQEFVDHLTGEIAAGALEDAGFGRP